jgi:hypothetical protein
MMELLKSSYTLSITTLEVCLSQAVMMMLRGLLCIHLLMLLNPPMILFSRKYLMASMVKSIQGDLKMQAQIP